MNLPQKGHPETFPQYRLGMFCPTTDEEGNVLSGISATHWSLTTTMGCNILEVEARAFVEPDGRFMGSGALNESLALTTPEILTFSSRN